MTGAKRLPSRSGLLGLFGSTLAGQVVGFLLGPLLARALGPAGRGDVALVSVYDDASSALFHCGLPAAIGYEARRSPRSEGALAWAALKYGLLTLPVSLPVGYLVSKLVFVHLSPSARVLVFVLVGLSPCLATLSVVGRQFLLSRGDLVGLQRVALAQLAARAVAIGLAFLLGHLTVPVAILAMSFSPYLGSLYAWRRAGVRPSRPGAPLVPLLRYGARALPASLGNLASGRLDQILMAPFVGSASLGLYAVAVSVNFPIVGIGSALGAEAFSKVSAVEQRSGRASPASLRMRRTVLLCAMGALLVATGVSSPFFVLLFGEAFAGAARVALLLLPGTVAFASMLVGQQILLARGRPGWGSSGFVTSTVILATCVGPVAAGQGLAGVAVLSTAANVGGFVVVVVGLRRQGITHMMPGTADLRLLVTVLRRRLTR